MACRGASLLLHQSPPPLGLGMLFLLRCHNHGPRNNSVEKLISNWNWVFSSICFSFTIKSLSPSLSHSLSLSLSPSLSLSLSLILLCAQVICWGAEIVIKIIKNLPKRSALRTCHRTVLIGLPESEREREMERERWREMEKPDDSNYQLCFVSCHNKFLHIIDGALYIR